MTKQCYQILVNVSEWIRDFFRENGILDLLKDSSKAEIHQSSSEREAGYRDEQKTKTDSHVTSINRIRIRL